jgi:hypothetical protein
MNPPFSTRIAFWRRARLTTASISTDVSLQNRQTKMKKGQPDILDWPFGSCGSPTTFE